MSRKHLGSRPVIDLLEFARVRGRLEGNDLPENFARLRDLLADGQGALRWRLSGERRERAEGGSDAYLQLHLSGEVRVECIRCLRPVDVGFDEERLFRVTATESQAERLDAESDDCDALVADPRFDVLELVEDEAILALPIAPRHADCGLPVEPEAEPPGEATRENPFAALAALKRSPGEGQGA